MPTTAAPPANGSSRKRKCPPSPGMGLGSLHDDMLERVLARLPPASYFRLRGVCRRWRAASASPTFLAACAAVPIRDPWFLMLPDSTSSSDSGHDHAVAFDAGERCWTRCRAAPTTGPSSSAAVPVATSGGLVLYRAPDTGVLTVANPLTGASRALPPPPPPQAQQLQAIAMYGAPYRVALFTGELPDLSMTVFDSANNSWESPVALTRKSSSSPDAPAAHDGDAGTVYFLSKSGDVVSTNMQRSASKQYSAAAVPNSSPSGNATTTSSAATVYFLSPSGTVVACDTARGCFAELPRLLPVYLEYSVDVVACGGAAYAVVLSDLLDTASLRVWEFHDGEWRQVAAMPPAMSHGFRGKKADVNCVGHGDRLVVCVTSADGEASGCFMCDVTTNRWEELPEHFNVDGSEATEFLAAFSFEPRLEITV